MVVVSVLGWSLVHGRFQLQVVVVVVVDDKWVIVGGDHIRLLSRTKADTMQPG